MKKALTILLAVAMMFCFSATAFAADFTDTADTSKVAQDAINKVAALGIVEGYEDGSFKPAANITRAEFAKMADIAAGLEKAAKDLEGAQSSYSDVKTNVWYTGWVNLASAQGYVKGYENGTYGPNNNITYAEVTTVLMRLLGYNDNLTGPWPINYINQATKLDVLDDVEGFSANVPATRANVAIMLAETLDQNMVVWDKDTDEWTDPKSGEKTLLEDAFDGATGKYIVTAVDIKDAAKGQYKVATKPYGEDDKAVGTLDCDATTAVVGVEPNALVGRQVTIVLDEKEGEASYIQAEDEIIEVGKAEAGKLATQVKLDGTTYDIADELEGYTGTVNKAFDTTKRTNADGNETGYALINDDDEVVKLNTDDAIGTELFGKYYLVTDVDTEDDAVITVNDDDEIDAEAEDIIIVKDGKRVATADVKAGDVLVDYTANADVTKVTFFALISNPGVKGEVTGYDEDGEGYTSVTVGDVDYVVNAQTATFNGDYESDTKADFADLSDNKDEIVVYKGADNVLAFIIDDNDASTATNYGILLGVNGSIDGFTSDYEVDSAKVYTKDGETKDIAVEDKTTVRTAIKAIGKGYPMTYKLNKDGEIKEVEALNSNGAHGDITVVKADEFPVANNKYVKVNNVNRSIKSNAVLFNVKDDFEVETLTAANVLAGDDITSDILDGETVDYLLVGLDKDNKIEFMAVTNFGGGNTVDYAIVDRVRGVGNDKTIQFVGDSKVYDLDTDTYTASVGDLVSYKLTGNTAKNVAPVTIADANKGITVTEIDGGLYYMTVGGNDVSYELAEDVVVIVEDGGDLSIGKASDIKKDKVTIDFIVDADTEGDDVEELELVVVHK